MINSCYIDCGCLTAQKHSERLAVSERYGSLSDVGRGAQNSAFHFLGSWLYRKENRGLWIQPLGYTDEGIDPETLVILSIALYYRFYADHFVSRSGPDSCRVQCVIPGGFFANASRHEMMLINRRKAMGRNIWMAKNRLHLRTKLR